MLCAAGPILDAYLSPIISCVDVAGVPGFSVMTVIHRYSITILISDLLQMSYTKVECFWPCLTAMLTKDLNNHNVRTATVLTNP